MKELIFPHMYHAAMQQYGEVEGIVDGDYRTTWNQHTRCG